MEISLIWGGVVVFVALLIKHEAIAKRFFVEEKYDNELAQLTSAFKGLADAVERLEAASDTDSERLTKLERQINDAQVAKSLGRGR